MKKDDLDQFSSKIKRLYIPLPNYKYFHKPTTVGDIDNHFVARRRIIQTLKNWLNKEKSNYNGSYLITGYRGMGKSSVVGKAIEEITHKNFTYSKIQLGARFRENFLCPLKNNISIFFKKLFNNRLWKDFLRPVLDNISFLYLLLVPMIVAVIDQVCIRCVNYLICQPIGIFYLLFIAYLIVRILTSNKQWIHHINICVSDEINSERDVLALIADSIKMKFKKYSISEYPSRRPSLIRKLLMVFCIVILFIMIRATFDGDAFLGDLPKLFDNPEAAIKIGCNSITYKTIIKILGAFTLAISISFLIRKIGKYVLNFSGVGYRFITPREVLKRLNDCCDRIDAMIVDNNEKQGEINLKYDNIGGLFSKKRSKSKHYPNASVREIEQELMQIIEIFDESWLVKSRLIIVCDELDKLIINSNKGNETESDLPEFVYRDSGFPGSSSYRVKKQNLLYLLAQLKFFISNAKAKFIFIAGRELFDAYKEDVSDREFSISSIFNGILNVDSFLTYKSGTNDVTRMTERYLCKQLFPNGEALEESEKKEDHDKLNLHHYFANVISNTSDAEKMKIAVFLNHFVTYLTYVSNGAPKKITIQFERYVITKKQYIEEKKRHEGEFIDVKITDKDGNPQESNYYLSFGYYDQQKINFVHYMVNPVFQSIISPASEYGDKLLVSASFLLGHIFKQHNGGFSMQNLEYLPELIENTRTPELREFIDSIITFLRQIQIAKIPTGLYEYKFHTKLREEISVFSKKSEIISAIFNFSRDYSLSVKQYFSDVLKYYSKRDECTPIVLANIHHYLGDLYMSSEEYSEAINHFRITKNLIIKEFESNKGLEEQNATLIARLSRVMLKMGHAYEKRNTIDSAYLVYSELANTLIGNRFIDEKEYGLGYKLEKTPNWEGNKVLIYPRRYGLYAENRSDFDHIIRPKFVDSINDNPIWWAYNDELVKKLSYYMSKDTSALISKISIYEDLRVAYTPLLAKLFSIEKQNVSGITLTNVAVTESEFRHLFLLTNNKEKYILSADFFRRLGNILYYKNSSFKRDSKSLCQLLDIWDYNLIKDVSDFCYDENIPKKTAEKLIKHIENISIKEQLPEEKQAVTLWFIQKMYGTAKEPTMRKLVDKFLRSRFNRLWEGHYASFRIGTIAECMKRQNESCHSCKYYNRSLFILAGNLFHAELEKHNELSKGVFFLAMAKSPIIDNLREKELSQIALSLESMAHVLLCCTERGEKKEDIMSRDLLSALTKRLEESDSKRWTNKEIDEWLQEVKTIQLKPLGKSIFYYFAAAEYYEKVGDARQATQCYVKIFNVVHMYVSSNNEEQTNNVDFLNFVAMLEDKILPRAIRNIHSSHDYSTIIEMPQFEKSIPFDAASNMPDVEDAILAFYKIKIAQEYKGIKMSDQTLKELYKSISLSCLRLDSLTYNRIMSLHFKAYLNKLILRRLFHKIGYGGVLNRSFYYDYSKLFITIKENGHKIGNKLKAILPIFDNATYDGFELLEFLITDSIFCLSNIAEYISPVFRTTLLTNNFCGDIYKELLEWVKIKELYDDFLSSKWDITQGYRGTEAEKRRSNFIKKFNSKMDNKTRNLLHRTYLGEVALKYYRKSIEMHSGGEAYHDFIRGMIFVNDDLQNDLCQFHIAMERYEIRKERIQKKINNIKNYAKSTTEDNEQPRGTQSVPIYNSKCYTPDSYWQGRE